MRVGAGFEKKYVLILSKRAGAGRCDQNLLIVDSVRKFDISHSLMSQYMQPIPLMRNHDKNLIPLALQMVVILRRHSSCFNILAVLYCVVPLCFRMPLK